MGTLRDEDVLPGKVTEVAATVATTEEGNDAPSAPLPRLPQRLSLRDTHSNMTSSTSDQNATRDDDDHDGGGDESTGGGAGGAEMQRLRDEFGVNLHKYQSVLAETESALTGVFNLPMPNFRLFTMEEIQVGLSNDDYEKLALLINSWGKVFIRRVSH